MSDFNSVLYSMLGERIKDRREESRLSQQQLSEAVSNVYPLKRSSISNIERGRQQPPIHVLYAICNILNFDIQTILPTYSEVQLKLKKDERSSVEAYLKTLEVDDTTRGLIENIINKPKK